VTRGDAAAARAGARRRGAREISHETLKRMQIIMMIASARVITSGGE
jgi:hypothetical protein